jgi:hypothetical protein
MNEAAIGVAGHMGWAAVAVVARGGGTIQVLRTERIETAPSGDKDAMEPYHLAAGFDGPRRVPRPAVPAAVVARGLAKQRRATLTNFRKLCRELRGASYEVARAGILSGRGRLAASLDAILASHAQIHVAEGIAVRESIASALRELDLTVDYIDRKSLFDNAARILGKSPDELTAVLRAARPENLGPWRQEQKLAALAAWCALSARARRANAPGRERRGA